MAKRGVRDTDRGWKAMVDRARALEGKPHVKVGVLADDAKGGLHVEGGELTVAEAAAVNEFGTEDGSIPSRPAHRMAFDQHREELDALTRQLLLRYIDGKISLAQALGAIGAAHSANVKNMITQGDQIPPPNAPSTARRKLALTARGAAHGIRTLVDTGRTIAAITWVLILDGREAAE